MRVRFWGTRGSIATPGSSTIHFGGNTSCVELTAETGARLIFDCGTGARQLGLELLENASKPISAAILLSHTHWDHIQGFPFFAPLFEEGSKISVYAPEGGGRSLRQVLAGQMETTYFPVELGQLPAELNYVDLTEGTFNIEGVRTVVQYLNHPAITLGYRVEKSGLKVAYMCDHEPFAPTLWRRDAAPALLDSIVHPGDRRHAEFLSDADLVIHDAQYTPEEYPSKKNWGHSSFEYVVGVAAAAGVKRLALTHHDPAHDDALIRQMEQRARHLAETYGAAMEVFFAYENCEMTLEPMEVEASGGATAFLPKGTGLQVVVVADDDAGLRKVAKTALAQVGYGVFEAANGVEALEKIRDMRPSLVVLDMVMPEMDGFQVLKSLRSSPNTAQLPVLVLTAEGDDVDIQACFDAGATDHLAKPFSTPQLAARIFACLSRTKTRNP